VVGLPVGAGVMSGVGMGGLDDGFLNDVGVAASNAGARAACRLRGCCSRW
jgi:flagellar hook-basal body complex protein FliE